MTFDPLVPVTSMTGRLLAIGLGVVFVFVGLRRERTGPT